MVAFIDANFGRILENSIFDIDFFQIDLEEEIMDENERLRYLPDYKTFMSLRYFSHSVPEILDFII